MLQHDFEIETVEHGNVMSWDRPRLRDLTQVLIEIQDCDLIGDYRYYLSGQEVSFDAMMTAVVVAAKEHRKRI